MPSAYYLPITFQIDKISVKKNKQTASLIIGITGGIASGKSTLAKFFREKGYPVLDADLLAHEVYRKGSPGYKDIVAAFGSVVLNHEEEIDRKILGSIVFSDASKRETLNSLVWPRLTTMMRQRIDELRQNHRIIFIEVALLIEASLTALVDRVWVVYADREVAVARLLSRNNLSREDAEKRIDAQTSNEKRLQFADIKIANNGSSTEFHQQLEVLYKGLS